MAERTCRQCGKAFTPRQRPNAPTTHGLFCSRGCSNASNKKPPVAFTCDTCGTSFTRTNRQLRTSKLTGTPVRFCSRACSLRVAHEMHRGSVEARHCEQCGGTFEVKSWMIGVSGYQARFCSRRCANEQRSLGTASRKCQRCGDAFVVRVKQLEGREDRGIYCSRTCATEAWNDHVRKHPWLSSLFRDGSSPHRYAPGFTEALKRRIRRRDRDLCVLCRRIAGRDGNVHHIDGGKEDHSPANLCLLCDACHGHVHQHRAGEWALRLTIMTLGRVRAYLPPPPQSC